MHNFYCEIKNEPSGIWPDLTLLEMELHIWNTENLYDYRQ